MELKQESDTQALGAEIANLSSPPLIIYLTGDLGTGKTTFARGYVQAFGHAGHVKSPTFTLIETYFFAKARLYHLDLYRLQDPEELEYIGLRDIAAEQDSICLIEWPKRGGGNVPEADIELEFSHCNAGRNVEINAKSKHAQAIIRKL